jgi:cell division protein FtsZ
MSILDHEYNFINPKSSEKAPIIKVIGVGGGGGNAVNYMFTNGIREVEFAICNTDRQALFSSPVETKIQLGAELLEGLGAGTDAEVGRQAAEESIEYIKQLMQPPIKMVFVTAGMGGGTGTGAAPVIARVAKEMGMLTVAVVTAPYSSEGKMKKRQAIEGINLLKEHCDTVLVILNDKLAQLHGKLPITKAFALGDNVLANGVKSIAEIITVPGAINPDFKDVEKVLKGAGTSVMSSAIASGEHRALKAIQEALNSPLLNDRSLKGAQRILITLASSEDEQYQATLDEQEEVTSYIESLIGDEPDLCKVGIIFDNNLGDKLQVTVVAAGFEDSHLPFSLDKPAAPKAETEEKIDEKPPVKNQEPSEIKVVKTPDKTSSTSEKDQTETTATHTVKPQEPATEPITNIKEPIENKLVTDKIKSHILNKKYTEDQLNEPAYMRYGVVLYEKPILPDNEYVKVLLDK